MLAAHLHNGTKPCLSLPHPHPHAPTLALVARVRARLQHRFYIVATCDKDLKRRLRKIPGVPIMYISQHKFTVERMPEAFGAPKT
ncbi:hypothetical protein EON67_04010 [archaeon]|nr:MAG: hypothetical protein EON67_04010 [archaeon]